MDIIDKSLLGVLILLALGILLKLFSLGKQYANLIELQQGYQRNVADRHSIIDIEAGQFPHYEHDYEDKAAGESVGHCITPLEIRIILN